MVSLLLEVSGQDRGHMKLLAHLLRIEIGVHVLSGDG